MNAYKVLAILGSKGANVQVVGGKLSVKAGRGVLNDELKTLITNHREDILTFLGQQKAQDEILPAQVSDDYPLSSQQRQLYFMQQLDAASTLYNMPGIVLLEGNPAPEKIERAFRQLISRHEVLRTRFVEKDEEPRQVITEEVSFKIERYKCDEDEIQQTIDSFIRPFDLAEDLMIRVGLVSAVGNSERHLLMVDQHHIITDGISQGILNQEFMELYEGRSLQPQMLHYKDYACWQQGLSVAESYKRSKNFWLEQFSDAAPALDLPTDYDRPKFRSHAGKLYGFTMKQELYEGCKALADRTGSTLYMVLLSVFNILISRLTNHDDIVVGTPVAGRQQAQLATIPGMFVNMLPLRNFPKGTLTFLSFLKEVQVRTLGCFDHQSYPYEELVESLRIARDPSRNPLFDIVFSLQNFERSTVELSDSRVQGVSHTHQIAKFDLTLLASEGESDMQLTFEYSSELFSPETIVRFADYFLAIVKGIVATPEKLIRSICMLSKEEEQLLIEEFNDKRSWSEIIPESKNLIQRFKERVRTTPGDKALVFDNEEFTYLQLDQYSDQVALQLKQESVGPGDSLGILFDRSARLIVAILGALKTGCAYLPIDVQNPVSRTKQILEEGQVDVLLTTPQYQKQYENIVSVCVPEFGAEPEADARDLLQLDYPAESTAYVIFTSGTTGKPKGVPISHANVISLIDSLQKIYEIDQEDNILLFSNIAFDASVEQLWLALLHGATLVVLGKKHLESPEEFGQYLIRHRVSHLHTTPSYLATINLPASNHLKRIIVGGEVCPQELALIYAGEYNFYNEYGPTETTVTATVARLMPQRLVDIGKPLRHVETYILGKERELLPSGAMGELFIGGKAVSAGYINNQEQSKERFLQNPWGEGKLYKTGDLARWNPDGTLRYLGRVDAQLQVRGYRVEPEEISTQLRLHSDIREAVLIGWEDEGQVLLLAFYTAEHELTTSGLREFLLQRLPGYMVPYHFRKLDKLPVTQNGKLDRSALIKHHVRCKEAESAHAGELESGNELSGIERELLNIWSKVLKLEPSGIGIHQNFFEMGGHSLKAIVMINKIQKATGVEIPLREIFERQDIRSQAAYIEAAGKHVFSPIPLAGDRAHYPLSPSQRRMYFIYLYDRQSLAYNVPQSMRIRGEIDLEKFKESLKYLISRQEILRTVFIEVEDKPCQKVLEQPRLDIEYYYGQAGEFEEVFRNFIRPFDLSKGPLFRIGIMSDPLVPAEYVLMLDQHHIITDGTSNSIFFEELMTIYQGQQLPELPCQYKDYSAWHEEQVYGHNLSESRKFWLQEYKEIPGVLKLPYDFPKVLHQGAGAARVSFEIDTANTRQILELSRRHQATVFSFLLAILNVMLSKLGDQEDIVVGTPVNGRDHADLSQLIGLFINTLPIRNHAEGKKSFSTFLKEVQAKSLACLEHQQFPYDQLVEILALKPEPDTNPLFETFFSFQNFEQSESGVTGLTIENLGAPLKAGKFDLTLTASESADKIRLHFSYSTKLFRPETIESFASFFKTILATVLANPQIQLRKIPLLNKSGREKVLYDFNKTGFEFPHHNTVPTLFSQAVSEAPESVAISHNNIQTTYSQLDEQSDLVASGLVNMGTGEGTVVGVLLPRSTNMIVVLLGILKAGAIYLPLNEGHPQSRRNYMLEKAGARLVVAESPEEITGKTSVRHIAVDSLLQEKGPPSEVKQKPSAGAYIIYTSGSTGNPKGVCVSHRNIVNLVFSQQALFQMGEQERILQFSNLVFDASMEQIWLALLTKATLVLLDQEMLDNPDELVQYISDQQVTHLHAVPSYLEILDLKAAHHLRRVVSAGEVCPPALAESLSSQYDFFNKYGPSETTVTCCMGRFSRLTPKGQVSLGRPIKNTRIYILDRYFEPVPPGVPGELFIAGEGVVQGYVGEPGLTADSFIPDPFLKAGKMYRSGDIGYWLPDGEIEYLGRKDDQVKIRGHRIETGEVNHQLSRHTLISESAVVFNKESANPVLVGYYVSEEELPANELIRFLSDKLPAYMLPAAFVRLAEMPRMASGKIDFSELKALTVFSVSEGKRPETEVQSKLSSIFAEVLGLNGPDISTDQGFFDLGGHSLSTIRLMRQLNTAFSMSFDLAGLMSNPDIQTLEAQIEQQQASVILQDEFMIRMSDNGPEMSNLFFVHDVSGDILGYMELATLLSDRNCWGLRSTTLATLEPLEADVRELAGEFIKKIKSVQPSGPYELAGWSMGGTLAYEVAFQLEAMGDRVIRVIMIDSRFPRVEKGVRPDNFRLAEEQKRLSTIGELQFDLKDCQTMHELWKCTVKTLEDNRMIDQLHQWLPIPYQKLINSLEATNVYQVTNYVNTFRSLQYAISGYVPIPRLNAPLLYIKAKDSKLSVQDLGRFFSAVEFHTVDGDHFTILRQPNVTQIFGLIKACEQGLMTSEMHIPGSMPLS